jgi:hypothetical protein
MALHFQHCKSDKQKENGNKRNQRRKRQVPQRIDIHCPTHGVVSPQLTHSHLGTDKPGSELFFFPCRGSDEKDGF